MLGRMGILLVVVVLVLFSLSCARISEASTPGEGAFFKKALPHVDSIPSKWGNLVSVSNVAGSRYWIQLWFQDENGNLRVVAYALQKNSFAKEFYLLRRR